MLTSGCFFLTRPPCEVQKADSGHAPARLFCYLAQRSPDIFLHGSVERASIHLACRFGAGGTISNRGCGIPATATTRGTQVDSPPILLAAKRDCSEELQTPRLQVAHGRPNVLRLSHNVPSARAPVIIISIRTSTTARGDFRNFLYSSAISSLRGRMEDRRLCECMTSTPLPCRIARCFSLPIHYLGTCYEIRTMSFPATQEAGQRHQPEARCPV